MTAFLFYILKVIVCSALFAGCYWCLLYNGRFYRWNRFYIVSSVTLSIIIPLLNIPLSTSYMVMPAATGYVAHFATAPSEATTVLLQPEASPVPWIWLGVMLCLFIVFFLLAKEVISFVRILRLKRRSERICLPETVLYCTDDAAAPFTFFRTIFWKKGISLDSDEGQSILRHELAHVRLCHSWDKTLMQLVCCLFWMNPFFMLFRRELELVHEFAADSESNAEELSSMLLCTLYPNNYRDFASRFFQSPINRRISMISKNKNQKSLMNMLRKMSIVPIALVAIYLFACKSAEVLTQAESTDEEAIISARVEEKPPLFNSIEEFIIYLDKKVVYPPKAQEKGISGVIEVRIIIEEDGSLTDVKVLRGVDPLLDAELLRVINSSPKWTPGKKRGYAFTFNFRLKEQTSTILDEQTSTMALSSMESKTVSKSNDANDEEIILFALLEKEDQPKFNGSEAEKAFREWVYSKVVYPPESQENGIQGRVLVEFAIARDGSVTDVRLLRGVDPLLDNECLRVISASPKWTPGKKDGKPVKVIYQFQLVFRLNK